MSNAVEPSITRWLSCLYVALASLILLYAIFLSVTAYKTIYARINKQIGVTKYDRINMTDVYGASYLRPKFPLPVDENNITSKVIWVYWDDAPNRMVTLDGVESNYVAHKAMESCRYHNMPNWTIIRLNHFNLHQYMNTSFIDTKKHMTIQARTDMIRLTLLSTHGGVWADATMLFLRPLDDWIWDNLLPKGFWMYSRRCSWFMAAARNSYVAKRWYEGAVEYWSSREVVSGNVGGTGDYRWMDGVLIDLLTKDKILKAEIEKIPYLECDGVCGPHGFYADGCKYEVNQPLHKDIKDCLDHNPPNAMKLTHKKRCNADSIKHTRDYNKTNGHYAIYTAFHGHPDR